MYINCNAATDHITDHMADHITDMLLIILPTQIIWQIM